MRVEFNTDPVKTNKNCVFVGDCELLHNLLQQNVEVAVHNDLNGHVQSQ